MNNLAKTKVELASTRYKSTYTVQAILYKLANSLFSLPKHSLVVVDETGMIGNDGKGKNTLGSVCSD